MKRCLGQMVPGNSSFRTLLLVQKKLKSLLTILGVSLCDFFVTSMLIISTMEVKLKFGTWVRVAGRTGDIAG